MVDRDGSTQEDVSSSPAEIYRVMQLELLNTTRDGPDDHVQPEDLWAAVFADGYYETLSDDPTLASNFLTVTDRGPTWHYKKHISEAEAPSDVLALVAISALINDTLHQNNSRKNDTTASRLIAMGIREQSREADREG